MTLDAPGGDESPWLLRRLSFCGTCVPRYGTLRILVLRVKTASGQRGGPRRTHNWRCAPQGSASAARRQMPQPPACSPNTGFPRPPPDPTPQVFVTPEFSTARFRHHRGIYPAVLTKTRGVSAVRACRSHDPQCCRGVGPPEPRRTRQERCLAGPLAVSVRPQRISGSRRRCCSHPGGWRGTRCRRQPRRSRSWCRRGWGR